MATWQFYGRKEQTRQLREIVGRGRWFFVKITGRRRIGKTALIQEVLKDEPNRPVFYMQTPDSSPAGVLSAVRDALELFQVPAARFPPPMSLAEFAKTVGALARAGYLVALDEFQYFNRQRLRDFCSFLQTEVDALSAQASEVPGGLIVLGSLHTELTALLQDRSAPLYARTTDELEIPHLDIASILQILQQHATPDPERLLFLWNLFEGVPKFYRDCFEQGVLGQDRRTLLRRLFFESSSPLRTEAENWFLKELQGQYDVVLKFVARRSGCGLSDLKEYIQQVDPSATDKLGQYLTNLAERYRLIERRLPIFALDKERKGRYYIVDNFLRSWLHALANPVAALHFAQVDRLLDEADRRLQEAEGYGFERLCATLYAERSRKGIGDFPLSQMVRGFWDKAGTELDLVALDEEARRIRLGTCKRSADKLPGADFLGHVERFLAAQPKYRDWNVERVCLAPLIPAEQRQALLASGFVVEDLTDLCRGLD
jgi:hypothetical protein